MSPFHPRIVLFLCCCLAGLLAGCSSIDQPKGTIKKSYHTVQFVKPVGPPIEGMEESIAINTQIQDAIAAVFESQGIEVVKKHADLTVGYLLLQQSNVATMKVDEYFGYPEDGKEIQEKAHKEGVLKREERLTLDRGAIVIDIVDTEKDKLIYRNHTVRDVHEGVPEAVRKQRIEGAVLEAMVGFFK